MQPSGHTSGEEHPPADSAPMPDVAGRYTLAAGGGTAHDHVLGRTVAAKRVPAGLADQLESEARFLSRLDHAGTPGVVDLIRDGHGAVLLTRRLDGILLQDALNAARAGQPAPELATPADVAQLMIRVCEVVASAHAQSVVHRHLGADDIVLGGYGQIQVRGWQQAMSDGRDPSTLRYISPARLPMAAAIDGLHQDVRSLGELFFACLMLRPPSPDAGDPIGRIDPAERERLPEAYEAIIRKAATSDAATGYPDAMSVASDLAKAVGGGAPRGRPAGRCSRAWHFLRRRSGAIASALALAAVASGLGYAMREPLFGWIGWNVVAAETFADASWKGRWSQWPTGRDAFETRDGSLISTADREAMLVFRRRLAAPVAIEFTGQITPGSQPCDLSVLWSEAAGAGDDPGRFGSGPRDYMIQAGAFGNAFCAIFQNPGRELLAHANRQLALGRDHRIRVDIEPGRLRMRIDGETVLDHTEAFPTRSGYLALFGFYPGKSFRDVRVLQRSADAAADPTMLGDAAFIDRSFAAAAARYAQAAELAGDAATSSAARFKQGLAEWSQGAFGAADLAWSQVTDRHLRSKAACYGMDATGERSRAGSESAFEALWRERPDMRGELQRSWLQMMQRIRSDPRRNGERITRLLALHDSLFPEHEPDRLVAATTLLLLKRYQECLERYPEQRLPCADALLALGRPQDVLDADWAGFDAKIHALTMLGEYARVLALPGVMDEWRARVLCKLGRSREAVDDPVMRYPALIHAGRAGELLLQPGIAPAAANDALIALGRLEEAAGPGVTGIPGSGGHPSAMLLLGRIEQFEQSTGSTCHSLRFMRALESGDQEAAGQARCGIVLQQDLARYAGWFMPTVGLHVIDALQGDAAALDRIRTHLPVLGRTFGRRGWHVASAVLGDVPADSVLGMTTASEAAAWRSIAAGMRQELLGARDEALAAYAGFAGLPVHQRLLAVNSPDPDVEAFVAWRIRSLRGRSR